MAQSTSAGRAVSRFDVIAARLPASRAPSGGPVAAPAAAASSCVATDRALSCEREQQHAVILVQMKRLCLALKLDHMW